MCDLARPLNAAKLAQLISHGGSPVLQAPCLTLLEGSSSSCSRVQLNALLKAAYRICVYGSEQLHWQSLLWKNMVGLEWTRLWCSSLNVIFVFLLNHSDETIIHCSKVLVPVSENWVWGSQLWPLAGNISAAAAKSLQSCLTLCDPIDGSPPGSPVPGILQARTVEWVAISFSNAWKWKVKVKSLSRVWILASPWTVAHQAPPSMGFSRQECWSGVPLPSPGTSLENVKEVRFPFTQQRSQGPQTSCSFGLLRSDSRMHFLVNREELLYAKSLLRWRCPSSRKPEVCTAISFGFRLRTLVASEFLRLVQETWRKKTTVLLELWAGRNSEEIVGVLIEMSEAKVGSEK